MPAFIGLCTNGEEKRTAFFDEFHPDFPLGEISKDDFWRLLGDGNIPRFIFLRNGRVEKVWNEKVPNPDAITLADLLPRFYTPSSGRILVVGCDISTIKLSSLRSFMGIVTQETILFNDTVHNNIAYGLEDYDPDEVVRAAEAANAHEFISEMPYGYETVIGDRGVQLSGGQRQRIAIARALLKNPQILILDEATSSVDSRTEKRIQHALMRLMEGRTSFVIAHRLSTIRNADQVLVIDEGKIIERGSHQQLLRQRGVYYNLYMRQFKGVG